MAQKGSALKQLAARDQHDDLHFRCFAPVEDPESCEAVIRALSQALVREGVVTYFTKGSTQAAAHFWQEVIQARFRIGPQAQQVYCLSDYSTVAIVHRYPQERATRWSLLKRGAVLRLMGTVPLGKWRALNECAQDLEKQKQAFLRSHGEFLYLELIATQPQLQRRGLGSMLLHHICHLADEQQKYLYAEASSEGVRVWYRRHGFKDVMTYSLRAHAPKLLIMARPPRPQQSDPVAAVLAQQGQQRAAQLSWQREEQQLLQQQQRQQEPPYQSVRSRGPTQAAA